MFSVAAGPAQQGGVVPDRYIVEFNANVSDVPGLARTLAAENGGQVGFTYTSAIKGFSVHMSAQGAAALAKHANVLHVEPDMIVQADTITEAGATWGLDRIDQRPLPLNTAYNYQETGAGVSVYILDTGIRYTHTEFGGRASLGFDAYGGDGSDCYGHGTHVAGTVGGAKYGVAKGAKLVSVRVIGCNGSGTTSTVVAGLDWIAKNGARPGVANMSIGGASASSTLDNAVQGLFQAGIVSAVAAGNSSIDACTVSPSRVGSAMTVGASGSNDARASFSNFGSCVDWFAPGISVTSAYYTSDIATTVMSGTSMATPHTAGAAALFLQRNPGASPQQVRDGLFAQTTKGVITSAASANNHLLYTLGDPDNNYTVPNSAPTAAMASQCLDLACSFTDQSLDSDGTIVSWKWDFGDGATSAAQNPTHSYASSSAYTVKLTVTDNAGASSSASATVSATVIHLAAAVIKLKGGNNQVGLTWSGAATASVDIFKNATKLATVSNSGKYTDTSVGKGNVSLNSYRVCEAGSSVCSLSVNP